MKKPHFIGTMACRFEDLDDVEAYCRHHLMLIESIRSMAL